jgi:thiamine-monophosphate kinase
LFSAFAIQTQSSQDDAKAKKAMEISEDTLISRIKSAGSHGSALVPWLRLGPGDDAALLTPTPGFQTVLTCDWFLEGTHFLRDKHPADSVGWKCLARAISDIAAMGGRPRCFLLSLALPDRFAALWLDKFLAGLRRAARKFSCPLVGGDTTRQRSILINVAVLGEVRSDGAVLRSGAQAGDLVFVSGKLGQAELGLARLHPKKGRAMPASRDPLLRKHLYPEPRVELGGWLAENQVASAMMDVSDGLSTDLRRLCQASRVGARLVAAKIPTAIDPQNRINSKKIDLLSAALHGGDDYELLFTVPAAQASRVPDTFKGIKLSQIGEVTEARRLVLLDTHGHQNEIASRGWDPFRP